MKVSLSLLRHAFHWGAWLSAACMAVSAQAGVLSSPVSVTLTSPGGYTNGTTTDSTPVLLSDSVTTNVGIATGDGSNIGGFMLPGEFISFGPATADISLRVAAGAQDGNNVLSSGYLSNGADRARYVFSGLAITDEVITGVSVTGSGFTVPTNLSSLVFFDANNPSTLLVYLDTMQFTNNGGAFFSGGNLTIDLITRACTANDPGCSSAPPTHGAPEPASWALALMALAGAVASSRRRAGAAR